MPASSEQLSVITVAPIHSLADMGTASTTQEFLGLQGEADGVHRLTMAHKLLGGGSGSLFGGVGLASAMIALEALTGQSTVYMTCQFAQPIAPPAELVFMPQVLAQGRTVTQARLSATSEDRTILAFIGATGDRKEDHRGIWHVMPDAPPPEDLESLQRTPGELETLHDEVDVRMARGAFGFAPEDAVGRGSPSGDASTLFWMRMPRVHHDVAAMAILADYLPSAVGNAVAAQVFCSSLDNTIRIAGPFTDDPTSEWILGESHIEFVGDGFAIARGFLWSRDGRLLASANQSVTVAKPRPES